MDVYKINVNSIKERKIIIVFIKISFTKNVMCFAKIYFLQTHCYVDILCVSPWADQAYVGQDIS